jgi:hypothetical protein
MNSLVIFVKHPAPYKVKTRLGAQIGYALAADLYKIFIEQTIAMATRSFADRVLIAYESAERADDVNWALPAAMAAFPQTGWDLGQRMFNAFQHTFADGAHSTVIIGSDSPTLPPRFLNGAFDYLQDKDLVLGPAQDGGYYLIGLKTPVQKLFENIEWSSPMVLEKTLARAEQLQLSHALLPVWYDVDEIESLKRAARDDASGQIKNFLLRNCPTIQLD